MQDKYYRLLNPKHYAIPELGKNDESELLYLVFQDFFLCSSSKKILIDIVWQNFT